MVTVPTVNIRDLNSSLSSLSNRINLNGIQNAAATATSQLQAATTSALGVNVNDIVGGWQGLTEEVDDINITSVANRGIALLQENPPGLNLVNTFDAGAQSALQSITGLQEEITEGLNVVVASLPTAEGVGAALQNVSGKNLDEITDALSAVAPPSLQSLASSSAITQLTNSGLGIFNEFNSTVTAITSSFESYINQGFGQVIKDVIEATGSPISTVVDQLTQSSGIRVPESINRQLTSLLDQGDFLGGAELLNQFSDLDLTSLETELSGVRTSASALIDQLNPATAEFGVSTAPVFSIGSLDNAWDAASTPTRSPGSSTPTPPSSVPATGGGNTSTGSGSYAFTIVGSMEELEAELRSATREITETVLHWTANYIDQPHIGAEDVHSWHLQRGFSGCGYHYIIKRDGSIQRGRPINIQGAHANDFGHNRYSIGVSHVAGYNCTSGTPNPNRYISSESISDAQWRAQKDFLEVFYRVFPGGQVLGHNQISQAGKVDPGFDVDEYIFNEFGKRNALAYNRNLGPLSRAELLDRRSNPTEVAAGPAPAPQAVGQYPFIHPADRNRSIWTFEDYGEAISAQSRGDAPFGPAGPEGKVVVFRENGTGGGISVAVVQTSVQGDLRWYNYTLDEFAQAGGTVSSETRSLDNIVRIPT